MRSIRVKPEKNRGAVFVCSAVFILSGSLAFTGYAQAQIQNDERETSRQKSQPDPLLKEKSDAERYEKTYEDEDEFFSADSDEEELTPEEGPYNPAEQPAGPNK